jgi:hypothetical protein
MMAASTGVQAARARLFQLSDEITRQISKNKQSCARSKEWAALSIEARMAVMLLAGLDGDLSDLARKSWPEFTPAEKTAVQIATRGLFRALEKTFSIRGRAV